MVDALCTQSDDPSTEPDVAGVDFSVSDVLAVPFDGEVTLHRRGTELWIRQTEGCTRAYDTALFVVPKSEEPHEQTCSASCE
jgi:hypothetical protein